MFQRWSQYCGNSSKRSCTRMLKSMLENLATIWNESGIKCWKRQSLYVCLVFIRVANPVGSLGYRSNNFIVGLTNTDPAFLAPVLWNYTLCGQYPGTVSDGATVTVQCTNAYNGGLRFRYVIVQFPLINKKMNFCEIEVFTVGKPLIIIGMKFTHKVHIM